MDTPIQILSREIIKPSSPTPYHLKNMKLSYLDQLVPPGDTPAIFFYKANESSGLSPSNRSHISHHLKQSLSTILTSIYPLAGTLGSDSFVDCNDAGAEFIEAEAQTYLVDVVHEHNIDALYGYAPLDRSKETLLAVKLTFFKCGGISVGICFPHQLADCTSFITFVNAWAKTCRGEPLGAKFNFNLADHFPPRDLSTYSKFSFSNEGKKLATKRFVFSEEALMVLKKEATSPSVMNPTTVEAVTAFICKHIIEVAKCDSSNADSILPISHSVNSRTRMRKPLHSVENIFGNCVIQSTLLYNTDSVDITHLYQDIVSKVRSMIRKIDDDYILKAQTGDDYLNDVHEAFSQGAEPILFGSWRKFPIYEVNYGWGTPTWVAPITVFATKNHVLLVDTKVGGGWKLGFVRMKLSWMVLRPKSNSF